jgi:hypothetical protein
MTAWQSFGAYVTGGVYLLAASFGEATRALLGALQPYQYMIFWTDCPVSVARLISWALLLAILVFYGTELASIFLFTPCFQQNSCTSQEVMRVIFMKMG